MMVEVEAGVRGIQSAWLIDAEAGNREADSLIITLMLSLVTDVLFDEAEAHASDA